MSWQIQRTLAEVIDYSGTWHHQHRDPIQHLNRSTAANNLGGSLGKSAAGRTERMWPNPPKIPGDRQRVEQNMGEAQGGFDI
jgi:hypothetical protein